MPPTRKFSDADLKRHFDDTGNIRETARRLNVNYSGVYKRLVALNAIRSPTFDPGRMGTSRTIPEAITMVIPDIQAPAHHPDALAFLCAVRDKYNPVNVVCIGDELDLNWLSDFAKLPEIDQPHSEFAAAQSFLRSMFSEFPNATACTSNHVHGRFDRARTRGRIPPGFMRPIEDLIDAPIGWSWHTEIKMGDILFRHGHKDVMNLKRVILEEIPAQLGRHYSLILGHFHQKFGVATPDLKVGDKLYYGAFTGCLVDPRHPFFGYSRGYEKLGTLVIIHGRVVPVAMALDDYGRWTGKL
jgi:predicted phosphodiesterase